MLPGIFLLTALTGIGTWLWLERRLERQRSAAAVLRLSGPSGRAQAGAVKPLLVQLGDEVRGRMAARLLEWLRLNEKAERLLETSGLKWSASGLLHRAAGAFLLGFFGVTSATANRMPLVALAAGGLLGLMPLVYVRRKAAARVRQFEGQLPDALEFISRSMRAGHAFSVSLEMIHKEFDEPLSSEFRRTFEEQHLGQPLDIVLKKLSQRVPSLDVQFFVSAVLLQKRTGGNLAELLDKLAHLIRERFKLRGRIRAISAQGLMSGRILAAIPAAVAILMFVVNPQYARFFIDDPVGHQLLAAAVGLQIVGYLIIRKIVTIEV